MGHALDVGLRCNEHNCCVDSHVSWVASLNRGAISQTGDRTTCGRWNFQRDDEMNSQNSKRTVLQDTSQPRVNVKND